MIKYVSACNCRTSGSELYWVETKPNKDGTCVRCGHYTKIIKYNIRNNPHVLLKTDGEWKRKNFFAGKILINEMGKLDEFS